MKALFCWSLVAVVAVGGNARAQMGRRSDSTAHVTRSPLVGSYRLAWLEQPGLDGTLRRITDAKGSLIYTPSGQVSVQLMFATADTASPGSPVTYSIGGYEASFGHYVVDNAAHTVTHHYDGSLVRSLLG